MVRVDWEETVHFIRLRSDFQDCSELANGNGGPLGQPNTAMARQSVAFSIQW